MQSLRLAMSRARLWFTASLLLAAANVAAAQTATVTGTVTEAETGRPLSGVNVFVAGTPRGASTNEEGRYTITGVQPGIISLSVKRIGMAEILEKDIRVTAAGPNVFDFQMRTQALRLDAVVSTGVTDPTAGAKAPITVTRLTAEDMPVAPAGSVAGMVMGKIPGVYMIRGTGPQAGVNIVLRTPHSQFKSTSPMFVLDGVVLSQSFSLTTADIEALDVESIEVVRGAAAASLYGSRAANGVISITTRRGTDLSLGSTQIRARYEKGQNTVGSKFLIKPQYHDFRVNQGAEYVDGVGQTVGHLDWIDANGNLVGRTGRVRDAVTPLEPSGFIDNPYKVTYNHMDQFFKAGSYNNQQMSLAQNNPSTNFNISLTRTAEPGTLFNNDGLENYNGRVNLDHRLQDNLRLSISATHTRSSNEGEEITFTELTQIDPDVDLRAPGLASTVASTGFPYCIRCDSSSTVNSPLWRQFRANSQNFRTRSLVSANVSYSPLAWLTLDGNIGYDRSDRQSDSWTEKGDLTANGEDIEAGSLSLSNNYTDGLSGDVGMTFLQGFGDLTLRTTLRGVFEKEHNVNLSGTANTFTTSGVKTLNAGATRSSTSSESDIRALSALVTTGFDYRGKYVGDVLFRHDGSSLFGPGQKWHDFYRVSAAYRMAEEPWWPVPSITEFKLRFSQGTGGSRPSFLDQYEVLVLEDAPNIVRRGLGNPDLKPEHTTESEYSLDMSWNNRISLQVNYADSKTKNNIIDWSPPASTGYNTQWANEGTMQGNTWEATVQAYLIAKQNLRWEVNLVGDRSRHKIVEFNRPCYGDGWRIRCNNQVLGWLRADVLITDFDELLPAAKAEIDQFQINDDNLVVWVGEGNDYTEGVSKQLWGTSSTIDGITYLWGRPIYARDSLTEGNPLIDDALIGDSNPWGNFGFSNSVTVGPLRFYALLNGQIGGDIYNSNKDTRYGSRDHADLVQAGKPEELKKPWEYYDDLNDRDSRWFIESGQYVRLSEAQVSWNVPRNMIEKIRGVGLTSARLQLTGRNLALWTKYSGYDPEIGGLFERVDASGQPRYRTYTLALQLVF